MAIIYVFVMAFCLFGATSVRSISSSTCLDLETKKDFDATRFGGRWYQAGFYRNSDDSSVANPCNRIDYNVVKRNCTRFFFNEIQKTSRDALSYMPNSGRVGVCKPDKSARFMAGRHHSSDRARNEWILETDYESYAVVHRCTRNNTDTRTFYPITILTREQNSSQSIVDKAMEFVEDNIICELLPNEFTFIRNNRKYC